MFPFDVYSDVNTLDAQGIDCFKVFLPVHYCYYLPHRKDGDIFIVVNNSSFEMLDSVRSSNSVFCWVRRSSETECSISQCLRTWPYKFQWGWLHKPLNVLCDSAYYDPLFYSDLRSCFQLLPFPCKFYSKMFSIHLINDIYSFVKNEKNYNGWNTILTSTYLEWKRLTVQNAS